MGLAASQARFLAITSRKAYCEFQSMQIAQDKLSVTRDLSQISQDYQNSLNKTKLVWDYDGTGENPYNLSYGVLMTPSTLNNFQPYLITTRTGSVVLNGQLAKAAKEISPDGKPVARSEEGFKDFVNALSKNGVIAPSTAKSITSQKYKKNAGYGAEPLNKNGALVNNIAGLSSRLTDKINFATDKGYSTEVVGADAYKVRVNGNLKNSEDISKLTIGDLLEDDIVYIYTLPDGDHNRKPTNFTDSVDAIFEQIYNAVKNVFPDDLATQAALTSAKQLTESSYLNWDNREQTKVKKSTNGAFDNAVSSANKKLGYGYGETTKGKNNDTVAINLSNLLATFLTNFELVLNGYNSNYSVGATVNTSNFVTDDPYYNYVLKDTDAVDSELIMQADFYMQLYNNICVNGWTENENIEDDNYLTNALKNGTYFITSLNDDGYFYQGRYNEEDCIIEIKDEDAIAQAEAEYTYKKSKLTYKEEQLDLDLKNLDTEISSLTTEYDSVKNLISKNVEKVFTMFQ